VNDEQRPLELILARNLLSSISTPGFLVDKDNELVFFNEAAGLLLGKRFEETGRLPLQEWTRMWGPYGRDDEALEVDRLPLTIALRQGHPAHARFSVHTVNGEPHDIEVSALPLVATGGGFRGALAIFWEIDKDREAEAQS
jgi:PAS domain-containing protein